MIFSDADLNYVCERPSVVSAQQSNRVLESLPTLAILFRTGNSRPVTLLLDRNVDPNSEHNGSTPWQEALRYVYQEIPRLVDSRANELNVSEWLKMFSTPLEYKAHPRALVYTTPGLNSPRTAKPRYISVLSVINDVLEMGSRRS